MTLLQLLASLAQYGIRIRAEGTLLRYQARRGTVTLALREALAKHKPEIMRVLAADARGNPGIDTWPGSLRPDGTCCCCHESRWWVSVFGMMQCDTCHPPPTESLVRGRFDSSQ